MMNRRYWSATLYLILTVLGIILWLPIPEISHFIGASSLVYAFLFGVADHNFSFIALLWILFFIVNLAVWYVYGKKKNKYIYFFATVGLELLVSLGFICIKVITANYTDIIIAMAGFVIRLISCCILAYLGCEDIGKRVTAPCH